mgnify:CR=1 FL=1
MVNLILAVDQAGVMAVDGHIPWNLTADLRNFRALTINQTVVMGRKTWQTLPRTPLPRRVNVIMTANATDMSWLGFTPEQLAELSPQEMPIIAHTPSAVLAIADSQAQAGGETWIIGGASLYDTFIPYTKRIVLTEIQGDYSKSGTDITTYRNGDGVRNVMNQRGNWNISSVTHGSENGLGYTITDYQKM